MHKPNLTVPLAISYNQRGIDAYTNVTNAIDQRKINNFYEISKNAVTGAGALDLVKRPGVSVGPNTFGSGTFGIGALTGYLISEVPGSSGSDNAWLFGRDQSNNNIVSDGSRGITVFGSNTLLPRFIGNTSISSVKTIIAQYVDTSTQAQEVYFSSSVAGWTKISDADFTAMAANARGRMEHMDGFAFILDNDSKIWNSDLNSLSSWTAANFTTKNTLSDRAVGLAKLGNQIIAFGTASMEPYYNAGNASGSPLSPIKQLARRIGCYPYLYDGTAFGDYYAIYGDKIYFVGSENEGSSAIKSSATYSIGCYAYDGSNVQKVSTPAIDKVLTELARSNFSSSTQGICGLGAIGFNGNNAIYIATKRNLGGTQKWLMFFPKWNDWFEWTSSVFSPINNGTYFIESTKVDSLARVYYLGTTWQDSGSSYLYSTQFKLPTKGPERKRMLEYGVIGDTARSAQTITVEASDDDFQNFTTLGSISLASARKSTVRGGTYIDRGIRLSNTDALETRLEAFTALVK